MKKRIDVFTNKFSVNQRVRDTITGYTGTIIEVDPDSFNPPPAEPGHRRGTRHNPYRVRFDNYVLPGTPWKPETELEAI
jgi:heat shock protein HspQ